MAATWTRTGPATATAAAASTCARLGRFSVPVPGGGGGADGAGTATVVPTPTCLVYTRRGVPMHLTRSTLADLVHRATAAAAGEPLATAAAAATDASQPIPAAVHVHVDALLAGALATVPASVPVPPHLKHDAPRYLGLAGSFLLATQRDALAFEDDLGVTDKVGVITASRGRQRVTAAEYMRAARALGPGVALTAMADTVAATASRKRQTRAAERTLAFLDECLKEADAAAAAGVPMPALWGVVQGGVDVELRARSARGTAAKPVAGFVIEGLGTGEAPDAVAPALRAAVAELPGDRPRYAPGLSTPEEIVRGVAAGIDLFDSAYAVRTADLGGALVLRWRPEPAAAAAAGPVPRHLNLWDEAFLRDRRPLVEACRCYACTHHTRAYVCHLLHTHELLASVLLLSHNMHTMFLFMADIRAAIERGTFEEEAAAFLRVQAANVSASLPPGPPAVLAAPAPPAVPA